MLYVDRPQNANYRIVTESSASHTAGKVNGTYALADGGVAAVTGTGTLYPQHIIRINSAEYATLNGSSVTFRVKAQVFCNDVAPTSTFTFGLYPVTRPATSGGAGLNIITMGTVVVNSTAAITTPAADSMNTATSSTFSLPADGYYCLGFTQTTATVATSAHCWMYAQLQVLNA